VVSDFESRLSFPSSARDKAEGFGLIRTLPPSLEGTAEVVATALGLRAEDVRAALEEVKGGQEFLIFFALLGSLGFDCPGLVGSRRVPKTWVWAGCEDWHGMARMRSLVS
jgi:hypothetical protein